MKDKGPVSVTSGFKGGAGALCGCFSAAPERRRHEPETRPQVSGRCGLITCSVPTQNRHGGQFTVLRFSLVLTTWSSQGFS